MRGFERTRELLPGDRVFGTTSAIEGLDRRRQPVDGRLEKRHGTVHVVMMTEDNPPAAARCKRGGPQCDAVHQGALRSHRGLAASPTCSPRLGHSATKPRAQSKQRVMARAGQWVGSAAAESHGRQERPDDVALSLDGACVAAEHRGRVRGPAQTRDYTSRCQVFAAPER